MQTNVRSTSRAKHSRLFAHCIFTSGTSTETLIEKRDAAAYAVGQTIAVFYAENHPFMDMTHGIRVNSLATVKVRLHYVSTLL